MRVCANGATGPGRSRGYYAPDEVATRTGIPLPEHDDYETVTGLLVRQLGRMPEVGDTVPVRLPVIVDERGDSARAAALTVERLEAAASTRSI